MSWQLRHPSRDRATRGRSLGAGLALVAIVLIGAGLSGCGARPRGPVLVIGVDGATWDVIDPLLAQGRMPATRELIERGARGTIVATGVLKSPVIWTTVATGRDPVDHGIDDFLRDGVPVGSNLRRCPALWNIVTEQRPNLTVGVTGWFVTWPVEAVRGFMISDRLMLPELDDRWTPPELDTVVSMDRAWDRRDPAEAGRLERFTSVRFDPHGRTPDTDDPEAMASFLLDRRLALPYVRDETFTRAAETLQQQRRPDLHLAYFIGVDYTGHGFWRDAFPDQFGDVEVRDPDPKLAQIIPCYYEYMDEVIGRLVAASAPDTTVIVLSDHGFGAADAAHPRPAEHRYLTGSHRPEGVVIVAGPGVRRGASFDAPSHLDLAPTVLSLLGIPPGEEMPGRVWTEVFEPTVARRLPVERSRRYDEEWSWKPAPIATAADGEILTNLRALGYISNAPQGTPIFADGFEGGDPSSWRSSEQPSPR
jgi:hypothetical protein